MAPPATEIVSRGYTMNDTDAKSHKNGFNLEDKRDDDGAFNFNYNWTLSMVQGGIRNQMW